MYYMVQKLRQDFSAYTSFFQYIKLELGHDKKYLLSQIALIFIKHILISNSFKWDPDILDSRLLDHA